MVSATFFAPTALTKSMLAEVRWLASAGSVMASTAGAIFSNIPVRFPNSAWSQAPFTAPQAVCPRTKISFVPANLQANSMLPKISWLTKFPAMRTLKISPIPWSKTNSAGTRESIQLKTVAKGNCPVLVCSTCKFKSRLTVCLATKRWLPSWSNSSALAGEMASWDALVCAFIIVVFSNIR